MITEEKIYAYNNISSDRISSCIHNLKKTRDLLARVHKENAPFIENISKAIEMLRDVQGDLKHGMDDYCKSIMEEMDADAWNSSMEAVDSAYL